MYLREEAEPVSNIYVIDESGEELLIGVQYRWNNGDHQDKITRGYKAYQKANKIYKTLSYKAQSANLAA